MAGGNILRCAGNHLIIYTLVFSKAKGGIVEMTHHQTVTVLSTLFQEFNM